MILNNYIGDMRNVAKDVAVKILCAALVTCAVLPAGAIIPSWSSLQNKLDLGGVVKLTHDFSAAAGDTGPLAVTTGAEW